MEFQSLLSEFVFETLFKKKKKIVFETRLRNETLL